MRIALIAKPGHENTGVGRYTSQLRAALEVLGHEVVVLHPAIPLPEGLVRVVRRRLGWDLEAFFDTYPVWVRYPKADVYHVTSQNLATLLLLRRPPGPTVVTVHDIIPGWYATTRRCASTTTAWPSGSTGWRWLECGGLMGCLLFRPSHRNRCAN